MTDCLFCKIINQKVPATRIYEDEHVIAFDDINPQAPVHKLIIPKCHIHNINELKAGHNELLGHMFQAAKKIARDLGIADDGYRVVMNCNEGAGQTVFHIHLHLLGGRKMQWPPG